MGIKRTGAYTTPLRKLDKIKPGLWRDENTKQLYSERKKLYYILEESFPKGKETATQELSRKRKECQPSTFRNLARKCTRLN